MGSKFQPMSALNSFKRFMFKPFSMTGFTIQLLPQKLIFLLELTTSLMKSQHLNNKHEQDVD